MGVLPEIFSEPVYIEEKHLDKLLPKIKEASPTVKESPFFATRGIKSFQSNKYTVKIVDGNKLRNKKDTVDFGDINIHEDFPNIIPEHEIWVDQEVNPEEKEFLLAGVKARINALQRGMNSDDAYEHGLTVERIERIKKDHLSFSNEEGKPDGLIVKNGPVLRGPLGPIQVYFVDKRKVCDNFKTDWLEGANGAVYPWTPPNEIWIQEDMGRSDILLTIIHEYIEFCLMIMKGMGYEKAHDLANKFMFANKDKFTLENIQDQLEPGLVKRIVNHKNIGVYRTKDETGTSEPQQPKKSDVLDLLRTPKSEVQKTPTPTKQPDPKLEQPKSSPTPKTAENIKQPVNPKGPSKVQPKPEPKIAEPRKSKKTQIDFAGIEEENRKNEVQKLPDWEKFDKEIEANTAKENEFFDSFKKRITDGKITGLNPTELKELEDRIRRDFQITLSDKVRKYEDWNVGLQKTIEEMNRYTIPDWVESLGGKLHKSGKEIEDEKRTENLEKERNERMYELFFKRSNYSAWQNKMEDLGMGTFEFRKFRQELENVFLNNYSPDDNGKFAESKVIAYAKERIAKQEQKVKEDKEKLAGEIKSIAEDKENKRVVDGISQFYEGNSEFQEYRNLVNKITTLETQYTAAKQQDIGVLGRDLDNIADEFFEKYIKTEKEREFLQNSRNKLKELMKPKDPIKINPTYKSNVSETDRNIVSFGVEFVRGITNNGEDKRTKVNFQYVSPGQDRPNYQKNGEIVEISSAGRIATVVHELGHHIEEKPGVKELAIKFYKYRCGDEKPTPMEKITGSGVMLGEYGRKDNFDRYFTKPSDAYYCGKSYGRSGSTSNNGEKVLDTEIISMGIQALYEDPVGFCSKDPEYAAFIIYVLRM